MIILKSIACFFLSMFLVVILAIPAFQAAEVIHRKFLYLVLWYEIDKYTIFYMCFFLVLFSAIGFLIGHIENEKNSSVLKRYGVVVALKAWSVVAGVMSIAWLIANFFPIGHVIVYLHSFLKDI